MSKYNFEYTELLDVAEIVEEILMLESSTSTQQLQTSADSALQQSIIGIQETPETLKTAIARMGNSISTLTETLQTVQTAIARVDYSISTLMEKVDKPINRFLCDQCKMYLVSMVSMECGGHCHLCTHCYKKGLCHICIKCKESSSFHKFKLKN